MRRRSPSYSPPSRRGFGARAPRSRSPRGRNPARREPPTSLLVRNLSKDCRADDLRGPFGQFGPMRDVYLPKDYYTGEPRGFGFVQYLDPNDAEDARYYMNHRILHGREITVVFAEENRKKPIEMRVKERVRDRSDYDSRCTSPYYARSRSRSQHRSRSPAHRHYSRFTSPSRSTRKKRERSPSGSRTSKETDRQHVSSGKNHKSRSPPQSHSLPPRRRRSSHSRHSVSRSPEAHADYGSQDEAASPTRGLN